MSSIFSGSTFDNSSFDNNTDLVQQKKISLLDKVIQKRSDLGFSTANLIGRNVQALDADTVRINPSVADKAFDPMVKPIDIRLKSNNFGESFNSYEVNHGNELDPEVAARLSKQRDTINNELTHGWFNPATNQDVYNRGEKAKQILADKLKAVNEGKTGLDFALGEKDKYGRSLGDMKFSNENTSAIDAMNTPELNSSYNTPYNFAKQNKDTATLGQVLEDTGRLTLTGIEGIGSALGYGLEKTGIAPELGRQIQNEHFKHDDMLRSHLSDPIKQASQEPLLDKNNDLNPNFGWTSLATNVIPSIPGSVVMGGAGGVLAKGLGLGAKTILGSEGTLSKLITNGLGYGTSEGVFSAAQNADQWGQEQRLKPINEFKKSPLWNEILSKNKGNEESTKEDLINQGQSDIFKDTSLKTGALSGLPGMAGGMYGQLFKSAGTKITAKQALINSLKGMGEEALQEYPQSLFERRTTNQATKDYIDPNQDVSEGQWNDAAVGGLSGFAMGAMGAGGHIASIDRTKTPTEVQTPEEQNIDQSEAKLKPSIEDYQTSVDNITDDNKQDVINQGIKDFPYDGTLPEKIQMAIAIGKARDGFDSPEHDAIYRQINAEIQLQNFAKGMPNFNDVISDPNTSIEDIQDNLITGTVEPTSTNTGSLFNDIGRTKDPETLKILKGISSAKQKEYAESNTVNDPYVLATTGIETKNLDKLASETFSAVIRDEYKDDLNEPLLRLSNNLINSKDKDTAISALTKTISKVYSDKVDITPTTEQSIKKALNTINGLVTNKGTITIEPNDTLEQIHNKILPTFGSQPIENNGNEKANELVKANNNLFTALKSTSDVSRDKLDGKGLLPSYREHIQLINILIANNAPKQVIDARVNKLAKWVEYDANRSKLFTQLTNATTPEEKESLTTQLKSLGSNPFTSNEGLSLTSGSKTLAKELAKESKIMSDALLDIQNQVNGKTTESTSQTIENAQDLTNIDQEDSIEEINMDDIPEKSVNTKEPSFDEEQERNYQEYVDSQIQQQEAQKDATSNEITNSEEDTTSEDKTPVIEDLETSKQEFSSEYIKEIEEFNLVNPKKLKQDLLIFKPVKRGIKNPIFQMFSFNKVKDSLFGKYPKLFEHLFNLPEFTINTKDGLKAFEALKKEETKFQEAFKKSYLEKPFDDDPLIVLANQNVSNGKFDSNIVSAMFMGSIDWLMNKGNDTLFNFEKDIQSILSMDENTIPQNEISNTLSELGSVRAMVATGLGNNIFNLLKFTASKTYPENEIAKFKLSLGLHALNTLNNMGYITYSAVENSTFDKFKQNEVVNTEVKHKLSNKDLQDQSVVFVRIASDIENQKSVIKHDLKQILDTLKAGSKEITSMFESAYEKELPRTTKPNKTSVLVSLGFNEEKGKKATGLHTTQEITPERIDALTEYVQIPHTLNTPTMKLYLAMDEDARAEMELGLDFQEQKQQSKERSYRGKVLSYEKEKEALDKLLELSEQGSKPLYFMSTFWNQGRIGGTGIGHPQNNKWIRNLSSPKNYFVKIKPDDKFAITQFKLAVLEAFGTAAKSLTKEQIDPKFQEILEANQAAIDEINKQKEGKEFNQRIIINAVHKGKEKAHTLNGLVALSNYSSTKEFETNIGREVDGITNGVLIGLVLLAGVDNFERMKDVLAAAGLFENPTMDYATWKSSIEGKEDNYEQIARVFAEALDREEQTDQLKAIKHFIGELKDSKDKITKAGRNFAKPILLLTMFGKSTDKLANSVGDTVIATLYDELEKLHRNTELQLEEKEAKLEILKTQIQTILGKKDLKGNWYIDGKVVREEDNKASLIDLTMNNLLEFSLTQQDANSIIATVNHLFQPMIEEAINHNFGVTINNRKILNDAYFVVGETFKLGLQKELLRFQYEQYIKVHPDNLHPTKKQLNHFRANEGKEPSAEQMDKIIADLIRIQPRSPTKNSESLDQDLQLWNSERSSNHITAYKTQTGWNSKTGKLTYHIADENGKIFTQELDLPKSTTAHALSLIVNSLGVGVTIANIHNRDSNVMIDIMKSKFKGLAVHDAFIFNLLEAVEGSKLLNSSLIDSLNSFDVFQGAIDNLERVQEYLMNNADITKEINHGFTSPTEGLFSRQRFYTKDKKTKEIVPYYNTLDNFVERLKANQEILATQRQEQIWDHIPKGGVKQYGGQDSYKFTEETFQDNNDNKSLGSTPNAKDLLTDIEDLKKDITKENIVSEFDAMPKGDDETHNKFLRNFVSQVIAPVVEATELMLFSKATYTYGQYSTELKRIAINLGQALQEQYSPFKMSAQEVFAHEFSHAVTWTAYQMPKNGTLKRKIDNLFYDVRREFNKTKAKDSLLDKWDYVFNNTESIKVDNAPNSLGEITTTSYDRGIQEFIAFGATNKEFRNLIKRLQPKQLKVNQVYEGTGSDVIKEASWLETITNVFKKVLDSFMRIAKGNNYLEPLTQFDINVRLILAANTDKPFVNITAITDKLEAEVAQKTNEGLKKGLKFIAKGRNSKIEVIRSAAKLADAIPYIGGFQTNQVVRQTIKLITNPIARQFTLDLVKDITDVNENSKPITNTTIQQKTIDAERNKATDSDENNWSKRVTLNHEQDIAYNNILVRGDYESLNDAYGNDAIQLLKDKSFRDKEITKVASQIPTLKSKALNLANLMVHGKNMFNGMTEHNAVLIAKQGRNIPQDKYQKEIDLVTKLSRLYAIGLQDENQINQVVSLLENNSEGMKQMLMVHKELKKQQLAEINALTVIDGKTHTTLDPNKTIFLGTKQDEKHLVSDWKAKVIGRLERDPNDPLSTEGILYLVDVKMQNDWDAKAMATTDITPGSSNFQTGIVKTDRFKAAENREKAKLKEDGIKSKNLIFTRNNSNVSRVAIHNAQGKIIRYEYILDRETQEKFLNPRINVLRDLAAQKNGTTYRTKAYELNHKLVDALYDYWKRLGHAVRKDMIWVGSDSKYSDLYNTIPTETKEYIAKVFGTEKGFYMAEEELREVFGYRKQSITNWIQPVQADELKKTMGNMIYEQAKRFGLNQANIKALETMWIEGIAIAKDTIVVKSGVVSAANESSNFMTAKLAGVPVGFYYKNKISAMKAEQEYRRDSHAYLSHLSKAYGNPEYITKEIAQEMSILESALSTNEMSYLHDEGLASTVAEEGSYKDKHQTMLYNKTERARNIFDKLPKVIKDTLKVSAIAEGTKIYKLLDEIAQMGDITSRHVLVKWEEEKARQQGKTFDKNKAIDLSKFLFIQYHTVTNDLVQYGNDIGLLMFTKFAVKALKVLTYMVGYHPARLIALGLFEEMFTTTNWIWDTSMNKVANPIASMMATIDASPIINFTLTPPAYMDDRVFGALDAVLPI